MDDRTLFLADEIACAYVDDWLVLPAEPALGNVWEGLPSAVKRHGECWALTH